MKTSRGAKELTQFGYFERYFEMRSMRGVNKMGAIWKFKKVEYLNAEETAQAVADYLLGGLKEEYKILIQKVGNGFRVQYIKIKNKEI